MTVPNSETILSGDVVATADEGSALVELKSGARLKITEDSSIRFLGEGDKVQAELLAGAVVSESASKPALVVTTSKFQFAPSQEGPSRYAVALSSEQETFAGAMKGNLLIRTPDLLGSYILPEGEYATIPASSVDVPLQEKPEAKPTSVGEAGTVARQAGTVIVAGPAQVVQRQGQGAEIPLRVSDSVYPKDVVRTWKLGRVKIALQDGSFLNVCPSSVMRIAKYDAQRQQTQVELTEGLMRAEVVKLAKPGASFEVQTQTATVGVEGSVLFVNATPDLTQVCSVEDLCWVRNINPAIVGQLTLRPGQCTTVPRSLPPTPPTQTLVTQLPCQIYIAGRAWHVGRLPEAASTWLAAAIAAAAAAAVAVPIVTSPTVPF